MGLLLNEELSRSNSSSMSVADQVYTVSFYGKWKSRAGSNANLKDKIQAHADAHKSKEERPRKKRLIFCQ